MQYFNGGLRARKSHQKQASTGIRATIVPKLVDRMMWWYCPHTAGLVFQQIKRGVYLLSL